MVSGTASEPTPVTTTATVFYGTLAFLLFVPLLRWLIGRARMSQIYDKIPGPRAYPFVGTMYLFFGKKPHEIFTLIDQRTRRYDGIHRIWVGMTPEVRLSKAEYVEQIIGASKHIEKSNMYRFLGDWLGEGLLTSKGDRWFRHRKLITPTFHFNILDGFCEVFAENGAILVERLRVHADTGAPVNVYPFITKAALDIICETAMGVKVHAQTNEEDNAYVDAVYELSSLFMGRVVRPWLHPNWTFNRSSFGRKQRALLEVLHGYTRKVIQERKKTLLEGNTGVESNHLTENEFGRRKRLAFLDLLLQSVSTSGLLSDEDVREEVDTFMFEGHDTTTAGISWALFLLALHPEVQEQVHQEIDSIFPDGSDRPATMQDLNEMKLLERCLKETLRLYPSVAIFGRTLSEDVTLGGYHVPASTIVGIHTYNVHRDERFFPDAETFDPDRFLPENCEHRHPYAYIPFSAGPRNCIGQKFALLEEKSIVSAILRRYRIRSHRTRTEQLIVNELITRPKDGILLFLESRK
ncbi:cytochrome P450 4C1-like [Anopheles ziemanni]|uniref:cytochrome P450 4C1-like n=1 Tax=Anopheles coustani TaxID=139045 RepID=UPI002657BC7D|nr:cytochrome P450 4C1-like [Anopheles coustani]XP_058121859.1 cytochrome P450 4C1-like [Anopheles coustani]XP_058177140.1 cytochrome P450 4C1-like [Anopheles ziemanni]